MKSNTKMTPQQAKVLRELIKIAEGEKPKKMAKMKAKSREWTAQELEMIWIMIGSIVFSAAVYFS